MLWVGAALLALMAMLLGIDRLARAHLQVEATRTTVELAQHLQHIAPELATGLQADLPLALPAPTQRLLESLAGMAGMFRLQVYGADGHPVLRADLVPAPAASPDAPAADVGSPPPAATAIAQALAGQTRLAIRQGNGLTLPLVYSQAFVPIALEGRTVGVLGISLDQTERDELISASFRTAALLSAGALLASFALGVALWRRRMQAEQAQLSRLHYLAEHDSLTAALNLPMFREQLRLACAQQPAPPADATEPAASGPGVALLVVDIDQFKHINEHHGQAAGDQLLAQAAERMHNTLRGADLLGRLGGDRFAVLQTGVAGSADVKALAARLLAALAQPYPLDGAVAQATASVGAALCGTDGRDADSLMQHAELALQRARRDGRGRYGFYDPAMDALAQRRRQLTLDLAQALEHDGLQLHYQPLVCGRSGALQGYEALARWQHPVHGPVSPGEFIPLAEESGLIRALGRWVLHTACREAAGWPAGLSVAVNLSAAQFTDGDALVAEIRQAMQAARIPPARLQLEITESLLMNDTDQVLQTLGALQGLGVKIGMDDFGTGYSSLATLWRFPFDKLKIDRAFTQGLARDGKADLIVQSIVSLGHALGMRVNAEGVETEAQRRALQALGCDELQGFLLGRPQPVGKLAHEASAQTCPEAVT